MYLSVVWALVAVGELTKQIFRDNPDFFPIKKLRIMDANYYAQKVKSWGVSGWLLGNGSTPLVRYIHTIKSRYGGMDTHMSVVFIALHSEGNYLRIQDHTLHGTLSSVDVATKENMEKLASTGHMLPACHSTEMPNVEALKTFSIFKYAKLLSYKRRISETRSPK
ncbi:hypothetical protein BS78_02G196000 [Paspalum vaginatum]|nr:hypothetical protein BS78_02G196000 [Paspalum vaginatum]